MIDTIRFQVRPLDKRSMEVAKSLIDTSCIIENSTGEIKSEFVRGALKGSWDASIRVCVKNREYKRFDVSNVSAVIGPKKIYRTTSVPIDVECEEYLEIELSVPKAVYGVNFFNDDIYDDINSLMLIKRFFRLQGVKLPPFDQWYIKRVDVAYNYDLEIEDNVISYFSTFRNVEFPRRRHHLYDTAIYFPGSTTTVKLYGKFSEFKVHDRKRLKNYVDSHFSDAVHELTRGLIRFEIEIKSRKLKDLEINSLSDFLKFSKDRIGDFMNCELKKIMGGLSHSKVTKFQDVVEHINNPGFDIKGISRSSLLACYTLLSTSGKSECKRQMGKDMTYRALKIFDLMGISLVSDLETVEVNSVLTDVDLRVCPGVPDHRKDKYLSLCRNYEGMKIAV